MLERLLEIERSSFLWLNSFHSPFTDQLMWLISGNIAWIPLVFCFVLVLFLKNKKRWKEVLLLFLAIALVIALCDQFSSTICKPLFSRLRPTHHPDFKDQVNTVFNYRSGQYGFISGHATNAFGFVMLTTLIFKSRFYAISLFTWAFVFAYSRIYLGVHFISDIIPGIVAGLLIGWMVYSCYKRVYRSLFVVNSQNTEDNRQNFQGLNIVLYLLLATVFAMLIISFLYDQQWITAITTK